MSDLLIEIGEWLHKEWPFLTAEQWMDVVVQGPIQVSRDLCAAYRAHIGNEVEERINRTRKKENAEIWA